MRLFGCESESHLAFLATNSRLDRSDRFVLLTISRKATAVDSIDSVIHAI